MAKRKIKRRTPYQKLKREAWDWCSRYIRLRDALDYARKHGLSLDTGVCACYTCGAIYPIKEMQAGHGRSRGSGGRSGIYFDERFIRTQCVQCNAFEQGCPEEFRQNLVREYGEEIIDVMTLKHKVNVYKTGDLFGLKVYFELETNRLLHVTKIKKWW